MQAVNKDQILLSIPNSTTTNLGIDGIFTGEAQIVEDYVQIIVVYETDQISATNGISLEFGPDGTTWPTKMTYTTETNVVSNEYGSSIICFIVDKYFRIVYTNGSTAQSFFHLQTSFKKYRDPELLTTPTSQITTSTTAQTIRMASEYKRDVAMGLISFNTNFIVNGMRDGGVGTTTQVLSSGSPDQYPWPQTARKLRIKAGGNTNDTVTGTGARYVTIIGLDSNFNNYMETLVTAGASASSWTTGTFIRVNTAVVTGVGTYSGSNEGNILIESETDLDVLAAICTGHSRSLSSVYTVPKGCSAAIPRVAFMCDSEHSATITGYFRKNAEDFVVPYDAANIINFLPGFSGQWESKPEELIKFEEMTDFWVTAKKDTGTGNAIVSVAYDVDLLANSM